jgi:hypothetical protein
MLFVPFRSELIVCLPSVPRYEDVLPIDIRDYRNTLPFPYSMHCGDVSDIPVST